MELHADTILAAVAAKVMHDEVLEGFHFAAIRVITEGNKTVINTFGVGVGNVFPEECPVIRASYFEGAGKARILCKVPVNRQQVVIEAGNAQPGLLCQPGALYAREVIHHIHDEAVGIEVGIENQLWREGVVHREVNARAVEHLAGEARRDGRAHGVGECLYRVGGEVFDTIQIANGNAQRLAVGGVPGFAVPGRQQCPALAWRQAIPPVHHPLVISARQSCADQVAVGIVDEEAPDMDVFPARQLRLPL